MIPQLTPIIQGSYRPQVAHRHVAALSQYHRIQASPGFREAAGYVAGALRAAGLRHVEIRRYPADGRATFCSTPSFLEWECQAATLQLLDERGQPVETLCDFAALPISVIQRSVAVQGDFEVVALPGAGRDEDAGTGPDLAGKLVLTDAAPGQLLPTVVRRHGAAGLLFDGMRAGGRSELDLPDARQYTSFWWPGTQPPDAWGFVLSPRQGQALRARLARPGAAPLRVRARIASRFYAGTLEVVEAVLPGHAAPAGGEPAAGEEVLLVSHLCHPQPGAHDNGSGAAALIETMATLQRLIEAGELPRPRRGIRAIWPPEMTGTFAWLAEHAAQVRAGGWLAGLNLDMVGADQNATGSAWELVGLPLAAPAFADHLLAWLREPLLRGLRHTETPFSAGSDHYILSDPSVGIPAPMLIQWPDRYYHTSADTPEKVSPDSLGRSGALAAIYAYWLAAAGADEARWLGHWMVSRFRTQAAARAAATVEALNAAGNAGARAALAARYERRNAFAAERMEVALRTLARLAPGVDLDDDIGRLREEVAAAAAAEAQWASSSAGGAPVTPAGNAGEPQAWRGEADGLVPVRLALGPVDIGMAAMLCPQEVQQAWRQLQAAHARLLPELGPRLQYWADGVRSIAAIADAVALEMDEDAPGELALAYFRLLADMGMVELVQRAN